MEKKENVEKNVEVDNSKKTNTAKFVILLVVAVLAGFLVGFGITQIDFDVKQGEKQEEKQEKKDVVRDLMPIEKKILLEQISYYNVNFSKYYGTKDLNISDQELLRFAYWQVDDECDNEITADAVLKKIKQYFYIDYDFKHQDIKCIIKSDLNLVNYNEDEQIYSYNYDHPGHGSAFMNGSYTYYVEGNVKNEQEVVVKAKVLYGSRCGDICGPNSYYGSYNDSVNANNPIISANWENGEDAVVNDEVFKTVSDKVGVTIFTFIKDDAGNYGLKSVTFE